MISFYIQETSYMKMESKYCILGVSIKINNEKKQKTLHSKYQILKDPCNGKQCQHSISSYGETTDHTRQHP